MKISGIFNFNASNIGFRGKRIVDYGAKDKDLVYVPILFEEEDDTFQASNSQDNLKKQEAPFVPEKPSRKGMNPVITTSGIATAAVGLPEGIKQIVKSYSDSIKESMVEIKSVKETYDDNFGHKSHQNTKNEILQDNNHGSIHHVEDTINDPFDDMGNSEHDIYNKPLVHNHSDDVVLPKENDHFDGHHEEYESDDGNYGDITD